MSEHLNAELDIQCPLVEELLVSFLREELRSAGFEKAVVGVSGGIDSAVSVALCARAFGPENVLGIILPYRTSNPDSQAHAEELLNELGTRQLVIDISEMVDAYLVSQDVEDTTRRGNVMARVRMTMLYDQSAAFGGLVVGTSNKTEMLLGYSTQFGDGAHAVNPLGDLFKHQVYQLADHLEIPSSIRTKAPSADLAPGQTDEADLGFSYAEADAILWRMVDRRYSPDEMAREGIPIHLVQSLAGRIVRNQFKRLPPVIAKLSERTINHDFRYLRDWKS